jgi:hypothetical protein
MNDSKALWTEKLGFLAVTLAWFSFTFYEFAFGIVNRSVQWPIIIQDLPGTLGMGFRTGASFIAVVTVLFWIFNKDFSGSELVTCLRFVIVFEAATFVSLIPSGVYTFIFPEWLIPLWIVELTIPVLTESILIPVVLMKLFFALSPNKPVKNAIKWALISGTVYIFVFWLNYTCNWLGTILTSGIEYVSAYPVNLFSFCFTSVGLLLLALYTADFTRKSIGTENLKGLDTNKIGLIFTFFGLYFLVTYLLWLIFGSVGGWSIWYAWFLNHNMDLWLLTAPILGLPLIFHQD